jgi:Glycosyl hydrolases family 18
MNIRLWLFAAIVAGGIAFAATEGGAQPAPAASVTASAGLRHLYAPYFETWTAQSLVRVARRSGTHHFTLAFIQAPQRGSCIPAWNGDRSQPVSGGRYRRQIAILRRRLDGDVIPSFGGYSADHALTEIADSCHSVKRLAAAYESVIRALGATRLDMDIEDRSLDNPSGIDRRSRALTRVERWARTHGRPLQISYTLPVEPSGLESDGLAVLRNAVRHGTRVDIVNIMTFDYYDGTTTHMGSAAIHALRRVHAQLRELYPDRSSRRLWAMEGTTIMAGIDDYPKKTEVTRLADASRVVRFARAHGMSLLSIWSIQRDNGGCPGTIGADSCSGIVQPRWAFSHRLERFTSA